MRHPKGHVYNIRGIPAEFWKRVQAKARAEGHTVRFIIMQYLERWLKEPS